MNVTNPSGGDFVQTGGSSGAGEHWDTEQMEIKLENKENKLYN